VLDLGRPRSSHRLDAVGKGLPGPTRRSGSQGRPCPQAGQK